MTKRQFALLTCILGTVIVVQPQINEALFPSQPVVEAECACGTSLFDISTQLSAVAYAVVSVRDGVQSNGERLARIELALRAHAENHAAVKRMPAHVVATREPEAVVLPVATMIVEPRILPVVAEPAPKIAAQPAETPAHATAVIEDVKWIWRAWKPFPERVHN